MSEAWVMLLWMAAGVVLFVVLLVLPMRWARRRREGRLVAGMQHVAQVTGFRLGVTGWGVLGGLQGELEGCVVQVEVSLRSGLPRLAVRHPANPMFELDKRAVRAGTVGWLAGLDPEAVQTLERWLKVPGFRSFKGALVLEMGPDFREVPELAHAVAHLVAEITRASRT